MASLKSSIDFEPLPQDKHWMFVKRGRSFKRRTIREYFALLSSLKSLDEDRNVYPFMCTFV